MRGSLSALDADARIGDLGFSQTLSMKVDPLVKKESLGGHHDSDSLLFIATGSRTTVGPAPTAYHPFVVDMTSG